VTDDLLQRYGLKFHPFRPDVPIEALSLSPPVEGFIRRVQSTVGDGGFVMVTGEPGTGKSVALRLLSERLRTLRDVIVGTLDHPQSRVSDFYREIGDIFGVPFPPHNRYAGFKALRTRWNEHISSTLVRPVLIIDEAQEMISSVFGELRVLTSKDFDSRALLCVVFAGDGRLPERLRHPELLPLGSRIRRRLVLEYASREQLCACLDHRLDAAGNPALMTTELKVTVAEHAAGNYRVMMNIADELLTAAAERDVPRLDEKLYFDVFQTPPKPRPTGAKKKPELRS
jgi:type II secretory pathway predicted ATPase ExeA